MARRFPGIEADYPNVHVLYLKNGIKSVNWLTILNEQRLSEVGGKVALEKQLDDNFKFYEYPGGIVI